MTTGRTDTERFYDAVAPDFEADYYGAAADPCLEADVRWFTRLLAEAIEERDPGSALEIGCGSGYWLAWLRDRGVDAIGVDISAEMCSQARAKGLTALHADASALPLPSKSYDLIISPYCALDHCRKYERAFREITRVAQPGATVVLMVDNSDRMIARYWRVELANVRSKGSDPRADGRWLHEVDGQEVAVFTKLFTEHEVRALLPEWELEMIGVGWLTPLIPMWVRRALSRPLRVVLRVLGPLERALCRLAPRRAALSVYVGTLEGGRSD